MVVSWHEGEGRTLCWSALLRSGPSGCGNIMGPGPIAPSESISPLSFNPK